MTPQELKASILQLAIQGKLVPQIESEGNAEDLYREIQKEKQRLIDEKKIKKEKPLEPIKDEDIPFDIPQNWKWCRLSELCKQISDGTHKTPSYLPNGVPFLSVKDISSGVMKFDDVRYISTEEHLSLIQRCKPEKGDVLMCRIGTLGKAIKITIEKEFSIFVSLGLIKPLNSSLSDYLVMTINSGYGDMWIQENKVGGGTHTNKINLDDLRNMPIPLPPLEEQKRIVAKIEELLPLVERYGKAYGKLEEFNKKFPGDMKKSVLQMAIQGKLVEQRPEEGTAEELYELIQTEKAKLIKEGKIKKEKPLDPIKEEEIPFDIPDSWKYVRVGEIGSWASGATPSRTNQRYYGGNIPWLKTGDLTDGDITYIPEFITDLALEQTSVRLNPIGSVLMAMYGATIGKLGILKIEATTNQACCACIPYNGVFNKYVFYYLMAMRKNYIGMAEGGAQPNISKEKIVNSVIPLPPLEEQKRIVAKLEEVLPLCDALIK